MPSYISKGGVWEPAMEYVVDPKAPRGQEVYSGPDRAALEELKAIGEDGLGHNYMVDTDLAQRAMALNCKNVEDYLKRIGFDYKKAEEKYLADKNVVNEHKAPVRKKLDRQRGGGIDTSGQGNDAYGGLGTPDDLKGKVKGD